MKPGTPDIGILPEYQTQQVQVQRLAEFARIPQRGLGPPTFQLKVQAANNCATLTPIKGTINITLFSWMPYFILSGIFL